MGSRTSPARRGGWRGWPSQVACIELGVQQPPEWQWPLGQWQLESEPGLLAGCGDRIVGGAVASGGRIVGGAVLQWHVEAALLAGHTALLGRLGLRTHGCA